MARHHLFTAQSNIMIFALAVYVMVKLCDHTNWGWLVEILERPTTKSILYMANYYTLYSVCFPFLRQRLAWKVFSLFFKYQIKLAWHPFSCNGDGYLYDGLGWNEENWSSRVHLRIRMNSWWWFSRLDLVNGVLRWCEMIVMSTWCVTTLRLTKLGSWCECYGLNGESISTLMTVEEVRTWIISISCGLTWVMQKGNCV